MKTNLHVKFSIHETAFVGIYYRWKLVHHHEFQKCDSEKYNTLVRNEEIVACTTPSQCNFSHY